MWDTACASVAAMVVVWSTSTKRRSCRRVIISLGRSGVGGVAFGLGLLPLQLQVHVVTTDFETPLATLVSCSAIICEIDIIFPAPLPILCTTRHVIIITVALLHMLMLSSQHLSSFCFCFIREWEFELRYLELQKLNSLN